jgi:hypothetical protein
MVLYTLDRNFIRQHIIDGYESFIWTERYYGDSSIELVISPTMEAIQKLPLGTFLSLDSSDEIMILETMNIEGGRMKFTGISLLPWLNNRFIRTSNKHADQHWNLNIHHLYTAGRTLWEIVFNMCCEGSPYLDGTIHTGIPNPQQLIIPGLGLNTYDDTGPTINPSIPYGPVYDALKEIAEAHEIGQRITLDSVSPTSYSLGYQNYRGLDRTSAQSDRPAVRFSPQMESLTGIKELQSIAEFKTLVYTFASALGTEDEPLITVPGKAQLTGTEYVGFDLRALMVFASEISTDQVEGNPSELHKLLDDRAFIALKENNYIKTVDGEIVPEAQFQYNTHYFLGDIIEMQGNTGVIQPARITEYIRSQDSSGTKSYPTVFVIDE